MVLDVGATEVEPEVPLGVKPEPVHEAALVEFQVSVADWPLVIEVGFTESETVGGVVTDVKLATRVDVAIEREAVAC